MHAANGRGRAHCAFRHQKWYSPEQLIGKTVVVAANLAPKTICGIESHGMILCASDASDENLSALTTMGDMASGLKVR